MNKAIFLVIMLAVMAGFSNYSHSEPLRAGLNEAGRIPYSFSKDVNERGIYYEILNAIGSVTGDQFYFVYAPPKRIMSLFNSGEIDVEIGINPKWREGEPGVYSVPFGKAEDVLVFGAGKKTFYKGPESLNGKRVGTIMGYVYPALEGIVRDDANSEAQMFAKLAAERYDQAVCVKETALYLIKTNSAYKSFEISEPVSSEDIMIRLNPGKKDALDRLNKAIKTLQESGEIQKIYDKYR